MCICCNFCQRLVFEAYNLQKITQSTFLSDHLFFDANFLLQTDV